MQKSQRNQLELLKLPQTKWMVQMLRRLKMDLNPADCIRFLHILEKEPGVRQTFQHVDSLSAQAFALIHPKTLYVLNVPLIREAVDGKIPHHELTRARENLVIYGNLVWQGEKAPRFNRMRDIENWLQKRMEEMSELALIMEQHAELYPRPPFPVTKHIVPILSRPDLIDEGRQMRHCVASHHEKLRSGDLIVFKIQYPQRATLALEWTPENTWRIFDFRLKCNRGPFLETWPLRKRLAQSERRAELGDQINNQRVHLRL